MRSRFRRHLQILCRSTRQWWLCLALVTLAVCAGCDRHNSAPSTNSSRSDRRSPERSESHPSLEHQQVQEVPLAHDQPANHRAAAIRRADQLLRDRDALAARAILKEILVQSPHDGQALIRLAALTASEGHLSEAVELLADIPMDSSDVALAALGQSADLCLQLERYDDAEDRFSRLLQAAPGASRAHRQLAGLQFRQGRRHEASEHIRVLCTMGNILQDELRSLLVVADSPSEESAPGAAPISPGGEARILFGKAKFLESADRLQPLVASGEAPPSLLALFGRAVVESQDDERYQRWLSLTDERTREFSDFWAAVGAYELSQRRFKTAARALAEAIDRDSTDYASIGRLRQALMTLGDEATAQRWSDRWHAIRATMNASNQIAESTSPDPNAITDLAEQLSRLGRRLEAVMWRSIANHYRGASPSELQQLNGQRKMLVANHQAFPSQTERLCGMDLSHYPMPNLSVTADVEPTPGQAVSINSSGRELNRDSPRAASFENLAGKVGLNHTFDVASEPQGFQHAIYQTLGGGVAVLDYDLDGSPDIYLAQGAADPPNFRGVRSNLLFRHAGETLVDVTPVAAVAETQYSIGVTSGDWNQDGFPDLVVSNIGQDMLLINHGDGTFSRHPLGPASTTRVPSSVAMADVTGDAIPDIFQTIYIDDSELTRKPVIDAGGRVSEAVSPGEFAAAADWLTRNDAAGRPLPVEPFGWKESDVNPGLGVVVTDFDGKPGNEIFVGNDLYPNQLWVATAESNSWFDVAPVLGCAFGYTGLATGSMGIATGDFDGNGSLDIHIANYENQNASLFIQRDGAFQDRYFQFRLSEPSFLWVGFGTQAIDYDNDGQLDLVVTNGHLDDTAANVAPYRQPPQLLGNLGDRFQIAEVQDASGYWDSDYLGRGLARLDFDRDGRTDFLITHIGQPTALMLNRTETDHHWIQVQLTGTTSERDAIGAQIDLRFGDQRMTQWVTAGDGYLSRNEAVVSFGMNQATLIDEIRIRWPSGVEQSILDVVCDQRILVIEDQADPWRRLRPVIIDGDSDRFLRSEL